MTIRRRSGARWNWALPASSRNPPASRKYAAPSKPFSTAASPPQLALIQPKEHGVATPPGIELGVERDPEMSDLIHRLQTLTPQQTRVLGMLAEGLLNKQIAYELGVSEATIKAHVSAVPRTLQLSTPHELSRWPPTRRLVD